LSSTSLWVTVQGRVVYVEGCVARQTQAKDIEAFVRGIPHVQQAIAIVTASPNAKPPYKVFGPG
jgi:osmotically-inducible protein OsmY